VKIPETEMHSRLPLIKSWDIDQFVLEHQAIFIGFLRRLWAGLAARGEGADG
jgi:hypothetical protein